MRTDATRCDWKGCGSYAEGAQATGLMGFHRVTIGRHEFDLCGKCYQTIRVNLPEEGRDPAPVSFESIKQGMRDAQRARIPPIDEKWRLG
jgi:hypothetical protein